MGDRFVLVHSSDGQQWTLGGLLLMKLSGKKPAVITFRNKTKTVEEWAFEKGISKSALWERWKKLGKPVEITLRSHQILFAPPRKREDGREERKVLLLPDNVEMTYRQLFELETSEIKLTSIKVKAKHKGYVLHRDDLKYKDKRLSSVERDREEPAMPEYIDPNYLPHIKWADLAHLSDEENTGAGKGEIPDEEWFELRFKTSTRTKKHFSIDVKGDGCVGSSLFQDRFGGTLNVGQVY